jgi:hypothetical protein
MEADKDVKWEDIPASEKLTELEIDAMDAKSAGAWDGFNSAIEKEIRKAVASKEPGKKLKELRENLGIEPIEKINVAKFINDNNQFMIERASEDLVLAILNSLRNIGVKKTIDLFEETIKISSCSKFHTPKYMI